MLSPLSSGISGSLGMSGISGSLWSDTSSSKLFFTSPLQTEEEKINLCTVVTKLSGVLYPCKHQVWPRDTQVTFLWNGIHMTPVSLYISIDFLAAARNTTDRCRDPPVDRASSMSYFTLMAEAALMYMYLWASGRYTIYCGPTQITCRGPWVQCTTLASYKAQNLCTE